MKKYLPHFLSLLVIFIVGAVGSLFTTGGLEWYAKLNQPSLTPPDFVFGPVWTFIYICLAFAIGNWWQIRTKVKFSYLVGFLFVYNLIANLAWSIAFFGYHEINIALWLISEIWFSLALLIILLWPKVRLSAYLLLPYILWVSFAGFLNYQISILN